MDSELAAFLDSRNPDFADTIFWANGAICLNLKGYLGVQSPPDSFVLAGRAIVVRGNGVLLRHRMETISCPVGDARRAKRPWMQSGAKFLRKPGGS
jgi:hypothetical protein